VLCCTLPYITNIITLLVSGVCWCFHMHKIINASRSVFSPILQLPIYHFREILQQMSYYLVIDLWFSAQLVTIVTFKSDSIVCVICYEKIENDVASHLCSNRCGLILCDKSACTEYHKNECKLLQNWKPKNPNFGHNICPVRSESVRNMMSGPKSVRN